MSNYLTPEQFARIQARLDAANAEMDRLTASNPGTAWRWSIPAKPDRDSDLVLSAPIADICSLLAHIDAQADALRRITKDRDDWEANEQAQAATIQRVREAAERFYQDPDTDAYEYVMEAIEGDDL